MTTSPIATRKATLQVRNATAPTNAPYPPATLLDPDAPPFSPVDITIVEGTIRQVTPSDGADSSLPTLDATGCTVLPGFIDIHVHGGMGHDIMDASPTALAEMATFFAQHGVTAFLPTTITAHMKRSGKLLPTWQRQWHTRPQVPAFWVFTSKGHILVRAIPAHNHLHLFDHPI